MNQPSLIRLAHAALADCLGPGDHVLDATCGQGFDTLFLARQVLPGGHVTAVDIQPAALTQCRARLEEAGYRSGISYLARSHHQLDAADLGGLGKLAAAVFNLGFLPGSDKAVTTTPAVTLAALDLVLPLLRPGGLLSVHAYSGHPGAAEEMAAVQSWAQALPWKFYQVSACSQLNKLKRPETLFLVRPQAVALSQK